MLDPVLYLPCLLLSRTSRAPTAPAMQPRPRGTIWRASERAAEVDRKARGVACPGASRAPPPSPRRGLPLSLAGGRSSEGPTGDVRRTGAIGGSGRVWCSHDARRGAAFELSVSVAL